MSTPNLRSSPVRFEDQRTVEQFLFYEARLLDEQRFEDWLALFAEDGSYWVPAIWQQKDPRLQVSMYYENRDLLDVRVRRLRHPRTETMQPPPRTCHMLTNVAVLEAEDSEEEAGIISTHASFSMVEFRLDEQRLFAGFCRHRLRPLDDQFEIVEKRVDLLDCDSDAGHVRFTIPF